MAANVLGIYAVPEAETLKLSINLNRVLHIYLVSKRFYYGKFRKVFR